MIVLDLKFMAKETGYEEFRNVGILRVRKAYAHNSESEVNDYRGRGRSRGCVCVCV